MCNYRGNFTDCGCKNHIHSIFFSKKKKIEQLKHYLTCLDERKRDIEDAITELKGK